MKTEGIKYLACGGLEIVEVDVPPPGPGEVQLETVACGICALDTFTYRLGTDAMPFMPPMGHEGVSYVTELGAGVEGFEIGQRVTGGSFTRFSNVPVLNAPIPQAYPLPESDLPDEHWIVEPVSCVVTGLDTSNLRPADRVAVVGCGFMGLLLIQGLAHSCLDRVIGIDINPKRLELASRFGADAVYEAASGAVEKNLESLRALDIDTVIETSGSKAGLAVAEKLVRAGGRINLFGWTHGEGTFSGDAWHLGGYTLVNSSPFGRIRDTYPPAIRLLDRGVFDLSSLVTHVVPLEEYGPLLDRIVKGEEPGYIKGVVALK